MKQGQKLLLEALKRTFPRYSDEFDKIDSYVLGGMPFLRVMEYTKADLLSMAFVWDDTPQGHNFWSKVWEPYWKRGTKLRLPKKILRGLIR